MTNFNTTFFRNKLEAIRKQSQAAHQSAQHVLDPVSLEDRLLGNPELVVDPIDTLSEIRRSLESNVGPLDTEMEVKLKGNKEEEPTQENDHTPNFRP